jgi:mannose-6-phosphate isomerase-like protein (cupin superfamily)
MRALVVLALAGCPGGGPPPATPEPVPTTGTSPAPVDAAVASEDEKLAMIGHVMTELAPVANQCWAAGAVDDYLLKGTVTLQITPGATTAVEVAHDTTDDRVLTECMRTIAAAYRWPPALYGEVIELPFGFDAPDGQFTVDRRLVPVKGQRGVGVAVLLDEKNSNNPAATLLELTFKADAALPLARATRHEVWYVVTGDGTVAGAHAKTPTALSAGAVIDVPAGAYRAVTAGSGGMTAAVFLVPGQIEGVARGGALPGETTYGAITGKPAAPRVILPAAAAQLDAGPRHVALYLDSAAKGAAKDVALSVLGLAAGAAVPEHVHAGETELLYVLAGAGTMVVDGVSLPITASTVIQIPKGVAHAVPTITESLSAIQLYTPGGPEQRFKK